MSPLKPTHNKHMHVGVRLLVADLCLSLYTMKATEAHPSNNKTNSLDCGIYLFGLSYHEDLKPHIIQMCHVVLQLSCHKHTPAILTRHKLHRTVENMPQPLPYYSCSSPAPLHTSSPVSSYYSKMLLQMLHLGGTTPLGSSAAKSPAPRAM
jgi:hypothetical protein